MTLMIGAFTIANLSLFGLLLFAVVNSALSLLDVCDDFMAEPFHRFREPEREKVRQLLAELNLLHTTTA